MKLQKHAYEQSKSAEALAPIDEPLLNSFRLSIMVPVYNERHFVKESLRRVLALESPLISSLEVIVVDDQSTDGTWEILQRLAAQEPRIVLLRNERNLGKGAAIRKAIEHSTGDVSGIRFTLSISSVPPCFDASSYDNK